MVEDLVKVGANLGGSDNDFAALAVQTATRSGDQAALAIWAKTGMAVGEGNPE